jgi:hypothetical protein
MIMSILKSRTITASFISSIVGNNQPFIFFKDETMQKFVNAFVFITLGLAEFAGFQITIFTPDWPIPTLLYLEWILFQVAVSLMLLIHVGKLLLLKEREAARLLNMAVFCLTFQVWGVLHSHQTFAAAATLSDALLMYLFAR